MVSLIYLMAGLNADLNNITKAPLSAVNKKISDTTQTAKAGIKRFTKIDGVEVEKTLKMVEKDLKKREIAQCQRLYHSDTPANAAQTAGLNASLQTKRKYTELAHSRDNLVAKEQQLQAHLQKLQTEMQDVSKAAQAGIQQQLKDIGAKDFSSLPRKERLSILNSAYNKSSLEKKKSSMDDLIKEIGSLIQSMSHIAEAAARNIH